MHPHEFIYRVSLINPRTKQSYESKIFKTYAEIAKYYPFFHKDIWLNIQTQRTTTFNNFVAVQKLYRNKDFKIVNGKFEIIF